MLDVQTGGTQSRKRPRTDSDTRANSRQPEDTATDCGDLLPVKCEDLKHHEELWFEDGSVILVAGNVGFRVYAGILSRDSVVFRNLLNAPGAKSEVMENCPVLRLQDTSADLEVFLSFVYSGSKSNAKQLPFSTISSLVRLGHKYEVYRLRDDGLARLKTCFPSEYTDENWEVFTDQKSSIMILEDKENAISVVNLARLTQTDTLLPMALYACTDLPLSTLLHGFHRPDGVLETLSPEDFFRCLEGMKNLLKAKRKTSVWIFELRDHSANCQTPKKCRAAISSLLRRAHDEGLLATTHALDPFLLSSDKTFCKQCLAMIVSLDDAAISRIFAKLPSYMGVTVEDWATNTPVDDKGTGNCGRE